MLREPQRHLGELFEWLGVPLEPADVAAIADHHAFASLPDRGADRQNRSATPGAWRENLGPDARAALEDILGAKLRELGYE
jgi:hypothetical protein